MPHNMGTEQDPNDPLGLNSAPDSLQRALQDARASVIVNSSDLLGDENLRHLLASGRVLIFEGSQTRRTEINVGSLTILVHKNPDGTYGAGRFDRIEIVANGDVKYRLRMRWDGSSSYYNPNYITETEDGSVIGQWGYGQDIDRVIASHYYQGQIDGVGGNLIDVGVLDLIDEQVGRGF